MELQSIKRLKQILSTEEGRHQTYKFFNDLRLKKLIYERHIDTFHNIYGKDYEKYGKLVESIIKKYKSEKYRDKWYSKGIEPPESLFFLLYDHAVKYYEEIDRTSISFKEHASTFTEALYYVNGFYIQKLNGQGTCILVDKDCVKVNQHVLIVGIHGFLNTVAYPKNIILHTGKV